MIKELSKYESVAVCGLFKERCVLEVVKRLRDHDINACLVDDEDLTISASIVGEDSDFNELVIDKFNL